MKKIVLSIMCMAAMLATAQTKGKVEVLELKGFKVHVYNTNDALGDASFIVEGKKGLVTLEHPLFNDNIAEFNSYLKSLNKPLQTIIADYHTGGSADLKDAELVMPAGMSEFEQGAVYGGMMKNFAQIFGSTIDVRPHGTAQEADFGSTQKLAGVTFTFEHGASSDFPGASIIIGKQVYYTHWTPAKAHISHLQVLSAAAIDAEIAEAQKALASGCTYFIGGHGGAAKADAVEFKIAYLQKMKSLLATNKTADQFVKAMKAAYPNLPLESNLNDLAKALYAK